MKLGFGGQPERAKVRRRRGARLSAPQVASELATGGAGRPTALASNNQTTRSISRAPPSLVAADDTSPDAGGGGGSRTLPAAPVASSWWPVALLAAPIISTLLVWLLVLLVRRRQRRRRRQLRRAKSLVKHYEAATGILCDSETQRNKANKQQEWWPPPAGGRAAPALHSSQNSLVDLMNCYLIQLTGQHIVTCTIVFAFAILNIIKLRNLFCCHLILFALISSRLMNLLTLLVFLQKKVSFLVGLCSSSAGRRAHRPPRTSSAGASSAPPVAAITTADRYKNIYQVETIHEVDDEQENDAATQDFEHEDDDQDEANDETKISKPRKSTSSSSSSSRAGDRANNKVRANSSQSHSSSARLNYFTYKQMAALIVVSSSLSLICLYPKVMLSAVGSSDSTSLAGYSSGDQQPNSTSASLSLPPARLHKPPTSGLNGTIYSPTSTTEPSSSSSSSSDSQLDELELDQRADLSASAQLGSGQLAQQAALGPRLRTRAMEQLRELHQFVGVLLDFQLQSTRFGCSIWFGGQQQLRASMLLVYVALMLLVFILSTVIQKLGRRQLDYLKHRLAHDSGQLPPAARSSSALAARPLAKSASLMDLEQRRRRQSLAAPLNVGRPIGWLPLASTRAKSMAASLSQIDTCDSLVPPASCHSKGAHWPDCNRHQRRRRARVRRDKTPKLAANEQPALAGGATRSQQQQQEQQRQRRTTPTLKSAESSCSLSSRSSTSRSSSCASASGSLSSASSSCCCSSSLMSNLIKKQKHQEQQQQLQAQPIKQLDSGEDFLLIQFVELKQDLRLTKWLLAFNQLLNQAPILILLLLANLYPLSSSTWPALSSWLANWLASVSDLEFDGQQQHQWNEPFVWLSLAEALGLPVLLCVVDLQLRNAFKQSLKSTDAPPASLDRRHRANSDSPLPAGHVVHLHDANQQKQLMDFGDHQASNNYDFSLIDNFAMASATKLPAPQIRTNSTSSSSSSGSSSSHLVSAVGASRAKGRKLKQQEREFLFAGKVGGGVAARSPRAATRTASALGLTVASGAANLKSSPNLSSSAACFLGQPRPGQATGGANESRLLLSLTRSAASSSTPFINHWAGTSAKRQSCSFEDDEELAINSNFALVSKTDLSSYLGQPSAAAIAQLFHDQQLSLDSRTRTSSMSKQNNNQHKAKLGLKNNRRSSSSYNLLVKQQIHKQSLERHKHQFVGYSSPNSGIFGFGRRLLGLKRKSPAQGKNLRPISRRNRRQENLPVGPNPGRSSSSMISLGCRFFGGPAKETNKSRASSMMVSKLAACGASSSLRSNQMAGHHSPTSSLSTLIRKVNHDNYTNLFQLYQEQQHEMLNRDLETPKLSVDRLIDTSTISLSENNQLAATAVDGHVVADNHRPPLLGALEAAIACDTTNSLEDAGEAKIHYKKGGICYNYSLDNKENQQKLNSVGSGDENNNNNDSRRKISSKNNASNSAERDPIVAVLDEQFGFLNETRISMNHGAKRKPIKSSATAAKENAINCAESKLTSEATGPLSPVVVVASAQVKQQTQIIGSASESAAVADRSIQTDDKGPKGSQATQLVGSGDLNQHLQKYVDMDEQANNSLDYVSLRSLDDALSLVSVSSEFEFHTINQSPLAPSVAPSKRHHKPQQPYRQSLRSTNNQQAAAAVTGAAADLSADQQTNKSTSADQKPRELSPQNVSLSSTDAVATPQPGDLRFPSFLVAGEEGRGTDLKQQPKMDLEKQGPGSGQLSGSKVVNGQPRLLPPNLSPSKPVSSSLLNLSKPPHPSATKRPPKQTTTPIATGTITKQRGTPPRSATRIVAFGDLVASDCSLPAENGNVRAQIKRMENQKQQQQQQSSDGLAKKDFGQTGNSSSQQQVAQNEQQPNSRRPKRLALSSSTSNLVPSGGPSMIPVAVGGGQQQRTTRHLSPNRRQRQGRE